MKYSDMFNTIRMIRKNADGRIVTFNAANGDVWKATRCIGQWTIICNGKFVANRVAS